MIGDGHAETGIQANPIAHSEHGGPAEYLYSALRERFGDAIAYEYVQ